MVCHLFIATNQVVPLRRQLRSMTSLLLSLSRALRTFWSRSREKRPDGKRKDVIMIYYLPVNTQPRREQRRVRLIVRPIPWPEAYCTTIKGRNGWSHLLSTSIDPFLRIFIINTASYL